MAIRSQTFKTQRFFSVNFASLRFVEINFDASVLARDCANGPCLLSQVSLLIEGFSHLPGKPDERRILANEFPFLGPFPVLSRDHVIARHGHVPYKQIVNPS